MDPASYSFEEAHLRSSGQRFTEYNTTEHLFSEGVYEYEEEEVDYYNDKWDEGTIGELYGDPTE